MATPETKPALRPIGSKRVEVPIKKASGPGDDKVHIDARITRHRRDGSISGTYDVIYVVTRENGRWGMKALSGLPAPRASAAD